MAYGAIHSYHKMFIKHNYEVCVCECLTLLYMCWRVSLALDTDRSVFNTNLSPLAVS